MLILAFMPGVMSAQAEPFLDFFQAARNGNRVVLSWQIRTGSTCNGITVHRSTDSLSFTRIGLIPGLCGSTSEAVRYQYTDSFPVINSRNYYRLEFGGVGPSAIIAVDIMDFTLQAYQVWPNPATSEVKIFFRNDEGLPHEFHLYTLQGIPVFTASGHDDFFTLDVSLFVPGTYIFNIAPPGSSPRVSGKILVQ